ncbi:GNAT family N-acetyltransferase [Macrococcus armenti]|uniref:GNAT family N-acetyltransferase n=1 Tax=Macrococcus armenti TaxID=2875764 RepID=UPI001CC8FEF0|nr:GNAT family N-acetyltransferase [Macrococcus armenti]UBH08433.1 GNAT family N-acetyltransferase [Macrococcus armenti]UBH10719.1 GNAT family N-acetyltransferase [Macrococcus armenti]UBH12951.1 GNAT family N-acetyltransferase [Macrococcus armenti]UBH15199.1 GNAT family N-acetyltransferase [Macrococcus armenti]UBH17559.1 GNAT family N-acetyltransferase [Macrococcus armenti]
MKISFACLEDIEKILMVQNRAFEHINDKEMLVTLSKDEIMDNINDEVLCVCKNGDEVIAFRSMHIPKKDYLGKYVSNMSVSQKNIIYSDISIVHPDYRGLGLQKKMGEWLFERIPEGYTIIMATVHPDNIASIKDKFHHDMHIIAKDFVYGDKVRYIFLKYRDERRKCGEEIAIHVDDVYKIERLLNEGFIAVDIRDNLLIFTK